MAATYSESETPSASGPGITPRGQESRRGAAKIVAAHTGTPTAGEPTAGSGDQVSNQRSQRRLPLLLALSAGLLWLIFLAVLSLFTANPPTVNWQQVREARLILLVRIADPQAGTVELLEVLHADAFVRVPTEGAGLQNGQLQVATPLAHWQAGEHRILPLAQAAGGTWVVPQVPLPLKPRLDYPDTPSVRQQMEEVWKSTLKFR